jgi:hypothetical protein
MITVLQKLSLVAYRGITDLTLDGLTPVSLIVGASSGGDVPRIHGDSCG